MAPSALAHRASSGALDACGPIHSLSAAFSFILSAVLVASCISMISTPLFGHISDRISRKKMYLVGTVASGVFAFLYFGVLDTAIPWAVFLAIYPQGRLLRVR